ncbi:MAG: helix-turn-helix domain-containing protein [Ruminococcus flavefaciens]|nr:helix-turn-helix domain-containing protein [Ruminococcus flavefaciens]
MEKIKRQYINWEKTAKNLKLLRCHNLNLRRYVCFALNYDKGECDGECETCSLDMDHSISQAELAKVFNVTDCAVANWENQKSRPSLEDLIFYSRLCGIELFDVLVFDR